MRQRLIVYAVLLLIAYAAWVYLDVAERISPRQVALKYRSADLDTNWERLGFPRSPGAARLGRGAAAP